MNLTVGRTIPSPWKRIKMQYVALAGGAALAISAIVAFGATMDGGSTATSAPNAAHPAIEIPASRQQTLTVYLVDSEAEAAAIRVLGDAARSATATARIHVAHISSMAAVRALEDTPFTSEATPHHLLLDREKPLAGRGKVNPPLRSAAERTELWKAFVDGRITTIASDHAPHTIEEKDLPFEEAPAGLPGVETMVPLLLRAVRRGELSLERLVDAAATRPAGLLRLEVGAIEVGHVANLMVVDPRALSVIRAKDLHSKCGWTPFEGFEGIFPEATYVHGELAAEARELVGEHHGRAIPVRAPGPSVAS